jgi:tubulin/ftsZ family, GTPase domain
MTNNTSPIKELEKYQSDYEKRAKAIEAISQEITLIGVGGGGVNFLANAKQKLRASYTFLEYNLSQAPNIEEMLLGVKRLFLYTSLGGQTGSKITPLIVKAAQSMGIPTSVVVAFPATYEGVYRKNIAQIALDELRTCAIDHLEVVYQDDLKTFFGKYPLRHYFEALDDYILWNHMNPLIDEYIKEQIN